jgi:hypothetical protein
MEINLCLDRQLDGLVQRIHVPYGRR